VCPCRYIVPELGPATETCSPDFNLNGGEVAVQPCVCLITTLKLLKNADKGEWHAPATNIIVLDELLTTVANISNLLPAFKCEGEG
jgi:hypothetical protein